MTDEEGHLQHETCNVLKCPSSASQGRLAWCVQQHLDCIAMLVGKGHGRATCAKSVAPGAYMSLDACLLGGCCISVLYSSCLWVLEGPTSYAGLCGVSRTACGKQT